MSILWTIYCLLEAVIIGCAAIFIVIEFSNGKRMVLKILALGIPVLIGMTALLIDWRYGRLW